MSNQPKEMETFTVEQFQKDFDNLLNRVEEGESFYITSENGNAVMVPYDNMDEFIKIHTDHEEGC